MSTGFRGDLVVQAGLKGRKLTAADVAVEVAQQTGMLAQLRDQGALTEDEFANKKGELLARL